MGAIALVALTATAADIAKSAPASAAFNCNPTSLNGGIEICIDYDPQGYRAGYRTTIQTYGNWMDFNLHCDGGSWFGTTGGAFLANQGGRWYTYVFKVGSRGRCHVTLYDRSASGQSDSPSVTR